MPSSSSLFATAAIAICPRGSFPIVEILKRLPLVLLFNVSAASAMEGFALELDGLGADNWHLQGLSISLRGLTREPRQLILQVDSAHLPVPLGEVGSLTVVCRDLVIDADFLACEKGRGKLEDPRLDWPNFDVAFHLSRKRQTLSLTEVAFAGGRLNVELVRQESRWRMLAAGDGMRAERLARWPGSFSGANPAGRIDFHLKAQGGPGGPGGAWLSFVANDAAAQSETGAFAAENLVLRGEAAIRFLPAEAYWLEGWLSLDAGGVYAEPVYLEVGSDPLRLDFSALWDGKAEALRLPRFAVSHPGHFHATGWGLILPWAETPLNLLSLRADRIYLDRFFPVYAAPFFAATAAEGVVLSGEASARVRLSEGGIASLDARFSALDMEDDENRLSLRGGQGELAWNAEAGTGVGRLAWDGARVYAVPIGSADIALEHREGVTRLSRSLILPVLRGHLAVERLAIETSEEREPAVHFKGEVNDVSLEELTRALNWTPMAGTISGRIPGVSLRGGRLDLEGSLRIRAFDGEVAIQSLGVADLFGDLPVLEANIQIDALDLNALTEKFEFGNIQGRLEGYVGGLRLEAWRPVAFDAWLGTPREDDSRHRISQRAVENLTSIGGGGAADVLSRGFLRFFDAFRYDRIGIGCRLRQGVCDLAGVAPADGGYYIIKGGGVPRIDVIGYNRRIDWNVLLQRLERVTQSEAAVVQ